MNSAVPAPAAAKASGGATIGKLINIDNGGTLTDICVIDGSGRCTGPRPSPRPTISQKCLFEGLRKVSKVIYGEDDVLSLLLSTEYIRYSTTQGTNALVERKGPRLGLVVAGTLRPDALQSDANHAALFAALVGERVAAGRSATCTGGTRDRDRTTRGDAPGFRRCQSRGHRGGRRRSGGGGDPAQAPVAAQIPGRILLGAIPLLYSHEVVEDEDDVRRTWTALFNAFLHPAIERFLYNSEHKLRDHRTKNPLLIFRNDGGSARVAKTIALEDLGQAPGRVR